MDDTKVKVYSSVTAIPKSAWNECFVEQLEDYNYLKALELSDIQGFRFYYITVEKDGKILLICPAFKALYPFKTLVEGFWSKLIPSCLGVQMLCLGSPFSEELLLGFNKNIKGGASSLSESQIKVEIFDSLIIFLKKNIKFFKVSLLAVKDLIVPDFSEYQQTLKTQHFTINPFLANAKLSITWDSLDGYFSILSKATRKDLRRKQKKHLHMITVEVKHSLSEEELSTIVKLYQATEARADHHFGHLNRSYFKNVIEQCPKAKCFLYKVNNQIMAANLVLVEEKSIFLDKYFCMLTSGRDYDLYVLSWLFNVEYCIKNNIPVYYAGQAAYELKKRLKCSFIDNNIAFWHKNKIVNFIFKKLSRYFM